jgi:hypothetical protein
VIEGPSGIGKTTSVDRALAEIGLSDAALRLSARRKDDAELIQALPEMKDVGTVIVDDFHRLSEDSRERLADFLKLPADEEREDGGRRYQQGRRITDSIRRGPSRQAGHDSIRVQSR